MKTHYLRFVGPAVLGALVLAGCGGSSSGSESTPAPNTTPWRTLAPVAATDPGSTVPLEGGVVNYTVKTGDYANGIAKRAGGGCSGAEIMDFNPDVKVLIPGQSIKIPGNCLAAGVTEDILNSGGGATDTTPPGTDGTGGGKTGNTTTTGVPDYAIYVVEPGDYWFGIVKKVGCSYKELIAANPGKTSLYPGLKIKVPVKCDTRADTTTTTTKKKGG